MLSLLCLIAQYKFLLLGICGIVIVDHREVATLQRRTRHRGGEGSRRLTVLNALGRVLSH